MASRSREWITWGGGVHLCGGGKQNKTGSMALLPFFLSFSWWPRRRSSVTTNSPVDRSVDQSVGRSVGRSVDRSIEQSADFFCLPCSLCILAFLPTCRFAWRQATSVPPSPSPSLFAFAFPAQHHAHHRPHPHGRPTVRQLFGACTCDDVRRPDPDGNRSARGYQERALSKRLQGEEEAGARGVLGVTRVMR